MNQESFPSTLAPQANGSLDQLENRVQARLSPSYAVQTKFRRFFGVFSTQVVIWKRDGWRIAL